MMVRKKLAVVIAALGALQTDVASALGLGELSLSSALNQPLEAEIKLLDTGELDASQVLVRLGAKEDFDRAGVSRDFFLSNMKFKVEVGQDGVGIIKINTRENVIEPYLDFIIEARWPSGRILREYTLLLDLPTYSAAPAPTVTSSPVAKAANVSDSMAMVATPKRAIPARPSSASSSSREGLRQGSLKPGESYRVRRDETLWEIAAKSRPSADTSVQQTMLGIQRANPEAFINGNINRLKAGYVLRLPTQDQIADITDNVASKEVANQNRAWKTGESAPSLLTEAPLDASASSASTDEVVNDEARLSIAGSGTDSNTTSEGVGTSANGAAALNDELDAAQENLDQANRNNDEMAGRLSDMETQMATLQRLLELKEDQLAALQSSKGIEPNVAEPKTAVPAAQPETGFIDELLSNPLYLGVAGGLIALGVVAALLRRRRQGQEEGEELEDFVTAEADDDLSDLSLGDEDLGTELEDVTDEQDLDLEEANVGDFAIEEELEVSAPVQSETGDAIAEADIYIAYGRFQQAMDLLKTAHNQEPKRSDFLAKLLEVSLEAREKTTFQEYYVKLQALGDEGAIIQVKEMLSSIDGVSDWLDDLPASAVAVSDADMDAELIEGDDELALDDFDDEQPLAESTLELDAIDLGLDDSDMDLDLDLDLDGDDLDQLSESKTMQFDTSMLNEQLNAEGLSGDDSFEADDLAFDLDDSLETAELEDDLALDDIEAELEANDEDGLSLDLDAEEELDLSADLELAVDLDSAAEDDGLQDIAESSLELDAEGDLDLEAELEGMDLSSDLSDLEALGTEDNFLVSGEAAETSGGEDFELSDELAALDTELDLVAEEQEQELSLSTENDLSDDLELETEFTGEMDLSGLDLALSEADSAEESSFEGDLSELELDEDLDESVSDLEALGADKPVATEETFDEPVTADDDADEFDFLADTDEVATKLDLARAYIDMGDTDGAKDILDEVVQEGSAEQQQEAKALLERV